MANEINTCPIWGKDYQARGFSIPSKSVVQVNDSPRAGGSYTIYRVVIEDDIGRLSLEQKARLTTWIVEQHRQGIELPEITNEVVAHIKTRRPLPIHERANKLLQFAVNQTETAGDRINVHENTYGAYAWAESTSWIEINYLIQYLIENGWLKGTMYAGGGSFEVTVDGHSRIGDQATNVDSAQAFVAMWFDVSVKEIFEKGIEPAIVDAGYNPLRIDRKEYIGKVDDQIIAEIRRSRFLVADFTQGKDGARGGVYYEAGFAHGLNLPVIFTCKENSLKDLHFDTNHYNHIVWIDAQELREKLRNRILAVIGKGPVVRT